MLGRAAYQDPYILAEVDQRLFGAEEPASSRLEVLDSFMAYAEGELARGVRLIQMTRHILGLFHGQPRARAFRRVLAENAHLDGAGLDVLVAARNVAAGERSRAVAAE
jgi:tRNA-dihydrouridine synthase A